MASKRQIQKMMNDAPGGYDPTAEAEKGFEVEPLSLRPGQISGLASPTGEGGSGAPSMRGAKAAKKNSPFTLKAEPRSTPKGDRLAAPAVQTKGYAPMVEQIYKHAEQVRDPKKDYAKPVTQPVFGPADPALTKALVPQRSVAGQLPPMPTNPAAKLPQSDRMRPILEKTPEIGAKMAEDLRNIGGGELPFYSTGSVLQGLMDRGGLSPDEANVFLRKWSGQGAATSPRTETPMNLRNASYMLYRNEQGDPFAFTGEKGTAGMNRPGFPMMKMHTDLAREMADNTADPWKHPKPFTFRENWSGNMADVTADTHNIRKILDTYDKLFPGTLSRQWFAPGDKGEPAWNAYQERGGFDPEGKLPIGGIKDTLEGAMVPGTGRYAQTEYPIMQGPTNEAARLLNISPAEAQERLWFEGGPRTNLQSPPVDIPKLLNQQLEATGRVLGIPPDQVMKIWARHGIPLAQAAPQNVPGESSTA